MKHYGLIGFPLSHSFSKKYFTEKFEKEGVTDHQYDLFELQNLSDFPDLLRAQADLCGLNVTVPHKIGVLHYMDWLSEEAKAIGAVNCIRITAESPLEAAFSGEVGIKGHNFRLEGFNTDVYGFEHSLKPHLTHHHKKALLLGDGGAARAVKYVLDKLEIEYQVVTRRPAPGNILFSDLTTEMMDEYLVVINTTPVGTYPKVDECPPIPYEFITDRHLLYDLIYNPEETLFLQKGKEKGATIKNGFEMLVLQAERSWQIWQSHKVNL
ncbi:shikimate dehydrogenase [Mucilaginibacter yixingensis]|uniref:Shikimate dehydrogenase n=1 Tax=Mucilaginibacter yixingensis TaxID=1295612 RepID=A0A2T5JDU9_9SPHI|nr:shikimate dehydrogenase [Mucilaginibacter yixingensis]PTQ99825.1 shikimate dehydrogenase [Mucilaginibacter yixingensis]